MNDEFRDPATGQPGGRKNDTTYFMVVGVLLLTICLTLSVLWLRERQHRRRAEAAPAAAGHQLLSQMPTEQQLLQIFQTRQESLAAEASVQPIPRDDLPPVPAELDGRPVTLRHVSAAAGRRIGLQPGDIILVAPDPPPAADAP